MIDLSLAEIAVLTGGVVRDTDRSVIVSAPASVDSRAVEPGGLFVAIAGERVDGHDFATSALAAGAAAVLCSRQVAGPCVVVTDPVAALGRIAAHVRERLVGCTVIGLTGSQGKTSVKDLLAQVLEQAGETVATKGNYNNELGVPLTVLRADHRTRFLVVEMGARGIGNIAYLCDIARPSIGIVLNIGTAHLGEFGSRENIAIAKGELVESLPTTGTAVLNGDDPLVMAMARRSRAPVQTFGTSPDAATQVRDLVVDASGEPHFELRRAGSAARVHLRLLGEHQSTNAAAAATAASLTGMDLGSIASALSAAGPRSAWRLERQVRADGVVVLNDAYNANPDSMAAALRTLAALARGPERRSVAIVGEMLELGDLARSAHESVGELAAVLQTDAVVVVGTGAAGIADAAEAAGSSVVRVADLEAATRWALSEVRPGDIVLVKASRASGLERVATALMDDAGHTAQDVGQAQEGHDAR